MNINIGFIIFILCFFTGCTGLNTFPTVARQGDTVSIMAGSTEKARKETIAVTLVDANNQVWDLQALGLVRSVFNLRTDGRAFGLHYPEFGWVESNWSWNEGHEPVQSVLVVDVPENTAVGMATINIDPLVDDYTANVNIEIIPGVGSSDGLLTHDLLRGSKTVNFPMLEPAPHGKISFGQDTDLVIGAISLTVDYDEMVLDPADLNIYMPEAVLRGTFMLKGKYGENQRMLHWRNDGEQLFIDIISPLGIQPNYLKLYLIHPKNITGDISFNITNISTYDINGNIIPLTPVMEYFP